MAVLCKLMQKRLFLENFCYHHISIKFIKNTGMFDIFLLLKYKTQEYFYHKTMDKEGTPDLL